MSEWQRTKPPQNEIIARKADEKLVQANSKITELEAKLAELQEELTLSCECRTNEHQSLRMTHMGSQVLIQNPLLAD